MYLEHLKSKSKEELVNDAYNTRIAQWADYENKKDDPRGCGKRIPYIGWFWRTTDFVNKCISIGDSGSFIGVMENNKWDYPERLMTEAEVDIFIGHLENAFAELGKGGLVSELHQKAEEKFREMWDWFQTLTIEAQHQKEKTHMHPDIIHVDEMAQIDQPIPCCIVLDEDNDPMIVPVSEAKAAHLIGKRIFTNKNEAQQHLRIIAAVADDLHKADRLRAAAWLLENKLLA